jgi:hypothetical protein
VFLLYPDGRTKFGWMTDMQNTITPNSAHFTGAQPDNSQIGPGAPHITGCSVWYGNQNNAASPNGLVCPLATALVPTPPAGCPSVSCAPYAIQLAEIVRYQLGTDTDGTIGLFRNWNGGVVPGVVAGTTAPSNPPGAGWQMVAAGIEDMQIEYVTPTSGGFVSDMPFFVAEGVTDNVVTGVRVTLWARALTDTPGMNTNVHLAGETTSQGGAGVTAVRGSLVTSTAPRSAQITLAQMTPSQWK